VGAESSDAETVVWEGRRVSVPVATLRAHIPTAQYRATNRHLEWTVGRLGRRQLRAPIWAVRDAEVHQSMQQRVRRVGDVTVSFQHRDYVDGPTFVVLEDVVDPKGARKLILDAARLARRSRDETR
jgi:hypothetical protein